MTPLEEVQAAHERLSELATGHNNGHAWMQLRSHAGIESACADGPHFIADATDERAAELIVILHRAIDAQLAIFDRAIHDGTVPQQWLHYGEVDGEFQFWREPRFVPPWPEVLALARAINAEGL